MLPAERGGRQLSKILETLALLEADGRLSIESLIQTEIQALPRGSTVVLITPSTGDGVPMTAEFLMRRGMRPVAVLLDAASFGGFSGSDRVENDLKTMGIPVCRIANGDDLSSRLSDQASTQMWA